MLREPQTLSSSRLMCRRSPSSGANRRSPRRSTPFASLQLRTARTGTARARDRTVRRVGTNSQTDDLETLAVLPTETWMATALVSSSPCVSHLFAAAPTDLSSPARRSSHPMGSPDHPLRHLDPLLLVPLRHPPLDPLVRRTPPRRNHLHLNLSPATERRASLVDRRLAARRRWRPLFARGPRIRAQGRVRVPEGVCRVLSGGGGARGV